jgi:hypothetical protein
MSLENTLSFCLSSQPNSVNAQLQGAGFIAGGFDASLRPSLSMLVADSTAQFTLTLTMRTGYHGINGSIAPMCLMNREAGLNGSIAPMYLGEAPKPAGIAGGMFTGGTIDRRNWSNDKLFTDKNNGKHSRPDGLPHSPPKPKRKWWNDKGGGGAAS